MTEQVPHITPAASDNEPLTTRVIYSDGSHIDLPKAKPIDIFRVEHMKNSHLLGPASRGFALLWAVGQRVGKITRVAPLRRRSLEQWLNSLDSIVDVPGTAEAEDEPDEDDLDPTGDQLIG